MVLASDFDKSKYLCAEDLKSEKKFRIKAVTVEAVGTGSEKEEKLVVWFANDKRGLVLNKPTTAPSEVRLATTSAVGRTRSSACFPPWLICEEKWLVACVSAFRRKEATVKLWQHHRNRHHRRRQRGGSLMSLVKRNRRRSPASPTI